MKLIERATPNVYMELEGRIVVLPESIYNRLVEPGFCSRWGPLTLDDSGYVRILDKGDNKAKSLSRLIMRAPKWAGAWKRRKVVHHIDGDRWNNSRENLELLTMSEHRWVHSTYGTFQTEISLHREELEKAL